MNLTALQVKNLFHQSNASNEHGSVEVQHAVQAIGELNTIFEKETYTADTKRRILELVETLGLSKSNEGSVARIRQIRGRIIRRSRSGDIEVVANGRSAWIGWAELTTAPTDESCIKKFTYLVLQMFPMQPCPPRFTRALKPAAATIA